MGGGGFWQEKGFWCQIPLLPTTVHSTVVSYGSTLVLRSRRCVVMLVHDLPLYLGWLASYSKQGGKEVLNMHIRSINQKKN